MHKPRGGDNLPARIARTQIGEFDPHYYELPGHGRSDQDDAQPFNPLQLLLYVIRHRWLIGSTFLVGIVVAVTITLMETPKYKATNRMEILAPRARVIQELEVFADSRDFLALNTAVEKLKSRDLARRVVHALGLDQKEPFLFPVRDFAVANLFNRAFGVRARADAADYSAEQREQIAVSEVLGGLDVSLVRNTNIAAISFRSSNPEYAKAIANQVAESYIDQRIDQSTAGSDLARQFIEDQVRIVRQRLQDSERALVAYAKREGITVIGDEMSLVATNIDALNRALGTAIQERLVSERLVQQIEAGNAAKLQQVLENESIRQTLVQIAALRADYQQKLQTFKPGFPEMQTLQAKIAELERQYDEQLGVISDSIRLEYEKAVNAEADLRSKMAELEGQQAVYQDKNIQYTILKREVDANRSQYQTLIDKLNEVGVGSDLKTTNAVIVDYAQLPGRPYAPRLSVNLSILLALSAVLSAAIVYVLELLNNRFDSPDEIEADLGLPVLGILPFVEADVFAHLEDQKSSLSEAYRSLRTSLQLSGTDGVPKSLIVISPEPGEAKSTTVYKIARDFSALGNKILVIDADLRNPNLHRFFGLSNTSGLSNILTNTVSRDRSVPTFRRTDDPNITVLSSGTPPPNPADLLASQRMAQLIEGCSRRFDLVLLDGPPILGLSDAPILSRLVEGVLLVVSAHQVSRKAAKESLKRIVAAGGHVVGCALSKFRISKIEYNYAYQYLSTHYYGYGNDTAQLESRSRRDANVVERYARKGWRTVHDRVRPYLERS